MIIVLDPELAEPEATIETIVETALTDAGDATGVLQQVGTRNAQNFELLKAVG